MNHEIKLNLKMWMKFFTRDDMAHNEWDQVTQMKFMTWIKVIVIDNMNEIDHMDSHGLNNMDEIDNMDDIKDMWNWNTRWNLAIWMK